VISDFTSCHKFLEVSPIFVRLGGGQSLYDSHSQGKLMRSIALFIFASLLATSLHAASYQKRDFSIVDPIRFVTAYGSVPHPYTGSNLQPDVNAPGINLTGAALSWADLTRANLSDAILPGVDLRYADVSHGLIVNGNLSFECGEIDTDDLYYGPVELGARLDDAKFNWADLSGADLRKAYMNNTHFQRATMVGANLTEALMVNANMTNAIMGSVLAPKANLTGADAGYIEGQNINLQDAVMTGIDFTGANLTQANLSGAEMQHARLEDANLAEVILSATDLQFANLSGTTFTNSVDWDSATWTNAYYHTNNEPLWATGMTPSWQAFSGILALSPGELPPWAVPEPAAILLALLGLALLPRRRRK